MKWIERPWSIPKQARRRCFACKIVNSVLLQCWNRFCVNVAKDHPDDLILSRNSSLKLKGWVFFFSYIYIYIYIHNNHLIFLIIIFYIFLFFIFYLFFFILKKNQLDKVYLLWSGQISFAERVTEILSLTFICQPWNHGYFCGWLFLPVSPWCPKSLLFPFLSFPFPFSLPMCLLLLHPNRGS